ncbi:MAG: acyl-protein synthetase [Candidatus Riflebacteria bacterium HGW-Riflebacteria-2]|jgi:hypothetical protein|nr:MAG: acyl-protein synthetase [Candidatus Riflebacteria bacterium HGW-Riflebacteria-2]
MKTIDLNLSSFTLAQKLQLLETLWDDICREGNIDSPEWHDSVLKDRQKAYNEGKIATSDWQQAKKRIKKNLSCE